RELEPLFRVAPAQPLVEADRVDVPVEDGPLEPQRSARDDLPSERGHERLADAPAPRRVRHDEILEVEEGLRAEGAEALVEERHPLHAAVDLGDERLEASGPEDPIEQPPPLGLVRRRELLEARELAVELEDARAVGGLRAADPDAGRHAVRPPKREARRR